MQAICGVAAGIRAMILGDDIGMTQQSDGPEFSIKRPSGHDLAKCDHGPKRPAAKLTIS